MYPSGDLTELEQRKKLLLARIAVRRWECAIAATELARPIALVDRGLELWHRVAPFVKLLGLPAAFVALRRFRRGAPARRSGSRGRLGMVLQMLPLILRGARAVIAFRASVAGPGAARKRTVPSGAR